MNTAQITLLRDKCKIVRVRLTKNSHYYKRNSDTYIHMRTLAINRQLLHACNYPKISG